MRTETLLLLLLVAGLAGCDQVEKELARHAEVCAVALEKGLLDTAEEHCSRALDAPGQTVLTPAVRSQRLFLLARIKRQLARFDDAEALLTQSAMIEAGVSGAGSREMARRHLERSLVHAGQGRWLAGADALDQALPEAARLDAGERDIAVNVLRQYARQLENLDHARAARFKLAAGDLSAR